ncbi:MAG: S-methyl-5-thioadenosine phosphorylase, partial [Acidimicrobiales bacterium]|nr:S-methyl-5-thioadenosine phosphorylase [Acidimicrobiales bacterium]
MVGRMDGVSQDHIGVIGGSGLYSFLTDVEHVDVSTPYGDPSGPVAIGTLDAAGGAKR